MADEVSTDVSMLEDSIDQSGELLLDLYATHGSNAQQILQNMGTGAITQQADTQAAIVGDTTAQQSLYGEHAALGPDMVQELMSDWDTVVGGIHREMAANTQAAVNRIESNNVATQNYITALAEALPLLEARLENQIENIRNASRGGGSSPVTGTGTSSLDYLSNPYTNVLTQDPAFESVLGAAEWAEKMVDLSKEDTISGMTADNLIDEREKKVFQEMWGIGADVWNEGEFVTPIEYANVEGLPNGIAGMMADKLNKIYGVDVAMLENGLVDGMSLPWVPAIVGAIDALTKAGMDPSIAHKHLLSKESLSNILNQFEVWNVADSFGQEDYQNKLLYDTQLVVKNHILQTQALNGMAWDLGIFGAPWDPGGNFFVQSAEHQYGGAPLYGPIPTWGERVSEGFANAGELEDGSDGFENESAYATWLRNEIYDLVPTTRSSNSKPAERVAGLHTSDWERVLAESISMQQPDVLAQMDANNLDEPIEKDVFGSDPDDIYDPVFTYNEIRKADPGEKGKLIEALSDRDLGTFSEWLGSGVESLVPGTPEGRLDELKYQFSDPMLRGLEQTGLSEIDTSNVNPGGGYESPLETVGDRFGGIARFLNPFNTADGPRNVDPIDLYASRKPLEEAARDPWIAYERFLNQ